MKDFLELLGEEDFGHGRFALVNGIVVIHKGFVHLGQGISSNFSKITLQTQQESCEGSRQRKEKN